MKKVATTIEADIGEGYNYDEDFPAAASPLGGDFGGSQEIVEFAFAQLQKEAQTQALAFAGENLVQQPDKIGKPLLVYQKTAKKIKRAMWTVLSKSEEDKEKMPDSMMFSELYREIPQHLSEAAAKNLSVPVAFVTFLTFNFFNF